MNNQDIKQDQPINNTQDQVKMTQRQSNRYRLKRQKNIIIKKSKNNKGKRNLKIQEHQSKRSVEDLIGTSQGESEDAKQQSPKIMGQQTKQKINLQYIQTHANLNVLVWNGVHWQEWVGAE